MRVAERGCTWAGACFQGAARGVPVGEVRLPRCRISEVAASAVAAAATAAALVRPLRPGRRRPRAGLSRLGRRSRTRAARRARPVKAETPVADGAEAEEPQRTVLFWDLDNKWPPPTASLATCLATLSSKLGPRCRLEAAHLYANRKGLRHWEYKVARGLLPEAWSEVVELSEGLGAASPGVKLSFTPSAGSESLPPASLTVTASRPQAADGQLVRDLMALAAPVNAAMKPGAVCLLSDDSDFGPSLQHSRQCGWRAVLVSGPGSWTLRKRSDEWLPWKEFREELQVVAGAQASCYRLEGHQQVVSSGFCLQTFSDGVAARRQYRQNVRVQKEERRQRYRSRWPQTSAPQPDPVPFPEAVEDVSASLASFVEAAGIPAADTSVLEPFLFRSSLGCPFVVISDRQLVADVRAPSAAEFTKLKELVSCYIEQCVDREAVLLTDFEGEMLGHGGVLATAAFQETSSLDASSLKVRAAEPDAPHMPGLLLDLGREACLPLLRRVLQSGEITKVLWGADSDCKSLIHQELPVRLRVQPAGLVDAQLAFSRQDFRLGMSRMLRSVPGPLTARLPQKELVDWNSVFARNRRAWAAPLRRRFATYAVDDLHRIEAILRSKVPESGDYREAAAETEVELRRVSSDVCGIADLREWERYFENSRGMSKTAKAVQGMRHLHSLRARGLTLGSDQHLAASIETQAAPVLKVAGVEVPADLSFTAE